MAERQAPATAGTTAPQPHRHATDDRHGPRPHVKRQGARQKQGDNEHIRTIARLTSTPSSRGSRICSRSSLAYEGRCGLPEIKGEHAGILMQ